ncbi:MAG: patatin-like phospholipase family protein, partial [Acidobacteria bacterium]|nr:patatin-like phospholipase family protein [Acidobacteriota bacterium]
MGIALCLSGGGFRAALYHLGALRRLHELGILQKVGAISSVSGGSICAAFLATRLHHLNRALHEGFTNWQEDVADPFRSFCARDLRTLPFFMHLLWNWIWPDPRVWHLERRYRKRLTRLKLRDLPAHPQFILCSTDLTFGVNWEFSRDGASDYQAGKLALAAEWPLARAVTASASFPPLFGPVRIREKPESYIGGHYDGRDRSRLRRGIQLSDGGVYDNMGLEPVWKEWTTVLVSDCGAPFDFKVDTTPWSRLLRYTTVVTNQTRALRLRLFFGDTSEPNKGYEGAYWSLSSGLKIADPPTPEAPFAGYSQDLATEVLSRIRTDLDSFSEAEMSVLENHGYFSADRSLRRWLRRELLPEHPAPAGAPYPAWIGEDKVRR